MTIFWSKDTKNPRDRAGTIGAKSTRSPFVFVVWFFRRELQMRTLIRVVAAAAWLVLLPVVAAAQTSSIAGTVRDASGAVMPGVCLVWATMS